MHTHTHTRSFVCACACVAQGRVRTPPAIATASDSNSDDDDRVEPAHPVLLDWGAFLAVEATIPSNLMHFRSLLQALGQHTCASTSCGQLLGNAGEEEEGEGTSTGEGHD